FCWQSTCSLRHRSVPQINPLGSTFLNHCSIKDTNFVRVGVAIDNYWLSFLGNFYAADGRRVEHLVCKTLLSGDAQREVNELLCEILIRSIGYHVKRDKLHRSSVAGGNSVHRQTSSLSIVDIFA